MPKITQEQLDKMKETQEFAKEMVVDCLDELPEDNMKIRLSWSKRMTRTAGTAKVQDFRSYRGGGLLGTVTLSNKIFIRAIVDNEQEGLDQLFNVVVHEMCHIYNYILNGDCSGHEHNWTQMMEKCGVEPERYHHMKTGADLCVDRSVRYQYPVGHVFTFAHTKDQSHHTVRVLKHNPKNCKSQEVGKSTTWNIPWTIIEKITTKEK